MGAQVSSSPDTKTMDRKKRAGIRRLYAENRVPCMSAGLVPAQLGEDSHYN